MLFSVLPDSARNSPLFSGMSEQEKDALIREGRVRNITRGEMLFAHGDQVTHFYMVVSGAIQLFRTNPDGHEKTTAIAKTGQTICEDEIMDSQFTHRSNAVAVEDAAVMEFPVAWLKDAVRKNSVFALNLLYLIAGRAHMAEMEAEHQATMSAAQLVACFFQRMCVLYDFNPNGFDLPYSKTLIASRLGMELETFSRTLPKLKDHGITVTGNHVVIDDIKHVGEYVCGHCSVADACRTHQAMEKKLQDTRKNAG